MAETASRRRSRKREMPPQFARYISRIAVDWAALEFHINELIWALAKVEPGLGACITAQIFSLDARLKALVTLLKIRRVDQRLIDSVKKFSNGCREELEIRNRTLHDAWARKGNGEWARLEITARHSLKFEFITVSVEDLKRDYEKVRNCVLAFRTIRSAVLGALPSLPESFEAEVRPILRYEDFMKKLGAVNAKPRRADRKRATSPT